ncbi:protein phosphatase 2C domain-containing protein [Streptomyces collinus]|uniref:protein phosphatase 2C domain-containing protein n=1 Tax=Streptomyces collinus TaxID=42684 RepID=UPI0036ED06F3
MLKWLRGRGVGPGGAETAAGPSLAGDGPAVPGTGPAAPGDGRTGPAANPGHGSPGDGTGGDATAGRETDAGARADGAPGTGPSPGGPGTAHSAAPGPGTPGDGTSRSVAPGARGPGGDEAVSGTPGPGAADAATPGPRSAAAHDSAGSTAAPTVAPPRTLPTDAPRIGHLQTLPPPRLSAVETSLPGVRADAGLLRDRWLGAASLAGQSHLNSGTTAQDAYQFTVSDDGSLLVAVVCDGLGSRPLTSQLGAVLLATLLCQAARPVTAERLAADPHAALGGVLGEACARLADVRAAVLPALADRDLACTAVLVLVPAAGAGWAARVGDCAVLTLTGEEWDTVFPREEGPLNRVSAALPHPAPAEAAEYARLPERPGGALVLGSDGFAEDVYGSPGVRDWLAERWSRPCDATAMADSLRYRRGGSHDDRTALVLWPPSPGERA